MDSTLVTSADSGRETLLQLLSPHLHMTRQPLKPQRALQQGFRWPVSYLFEANDQGWTGVIWLMSIASLVESNQVGQHRVITGCGNSDRTWVTTRKRCITITPQAENGQGMHTIQIYSRKYVSGIPTWELLEMIGLIHEASRILHVVPTNKCHLNVITNNRLSL